jgi:hypothetical protein
VFYPGRSVPITTNTFELKKPNEYNVWWYFIPHYPFTSFDVKFEDDKEGSITYCDTIPNCNGVWNGVREQG